MKIILDSKICEQNGFDIQEVLLLMAFSLGINYKNSVKHFADKDLINKANLESDLSKYINIYPTTEAVDLCSKISADSIECKDSDEVLKELAEHLKGIFPKGKKEGTNNYWAEGNALIVRRLKLFFKKYGDTYTPEQMEKAAKKYVESFNGDYSYMRILKYFIFKEARNANGEIEGTSDLITYIENEGEEEDNNKDWSLELK